MKKIYELCEGIQSWLQKNSEKPTSRHFCTPKWENQAKLWFLLYRWFIFLVWFGITVYAIYRFSSVDEKTFYLCLIYLTSWSLAFGVTQSLLGAVLVSRWWKIQKTQANLYQTCELNYFEKFYWVLNNVTTTLTVNFTIMLSLAVVFNSTSYHMASFTVLAYVVSAILVFLDFFIASVPFSARNFRWNFAVFVTYVIVFYVVLVLARGSHRLEPYYTKYLNWKSENLTRTVFLLVAILVISIILQCLLLVMSLLVNKFFARYRNPEVTKTRRICLQSCNSLEPSQSVESHF